MFFKAKGFTVENVKYSVLAVIGKNYLIGKAGEEGIIMKNANGVIIIARIPEGNDFYSSNEAVKKMAVEISAAIQNNELI